MTRYAIASTTFPSATVRHISAVIRSSPAFPSDRLWKPRTPATHLLADLSADAWFLLKATPPAPAYLTIAALLRCANQNVSSAPSAYQLKPASTRDASILVPELVAKAPCVQSSTTTRCAAALQANKEILSPNAIFRSQRWSNPRIHAHLLPADPTLSAR